MRHKNARRLRQQQKARQRNGRSTATTPVAAVAAAAKQQQQHQHQQQHKGFLTKPKETKRNETLAYNKIGCESVSGNRDKNVIRAE